MFTWISKPSEYGKITTASITELKQKIEALVCSSVHSGYYGTYHTTTACSITQSSVCSSVLSSHCSAHKSGNNSNYDFTDYSSDDGSNNSTKLQTHKSDYCNTWDYIIY